MLKVIICYYYYHFFCLFVCFLFFLLVFFLFFCFLFFAPNQNLSLDILNALLLVVLAHIKAFEKISYWAYQWKIQFNPDPTKQANEVIFSLKTSSNNNRPY